MKGQPYRGFNIELTDPIERGQFYGQVYKPGEEEARWQTPISYQHSGVAIMKCVMAIHQFRQEGAWPN